jgi:hypothetical protein
MKLKRFALMVFFAWPGCELERFAAEGSHAHTALERLREEANESVYDDDHIPDEVSSEDWILDLDLSEVVAPPTPHIAQAPPHFINPEWSGVKSLFRKGGGACAGRTVPDRIAGT